MYYALNANSVQALIKQQQLKKKQLYFHSWNTVIWNIVEEK